MNNVLAPFPSAILAHGRCAGFRRPLARRLSASMGYSGRVCFVHGRSVSVKPGAAAGRAEPGATAGRVEPGATAGRADQAATAGRADQAATAGRADQAATAGRVEPGAAAGRVEPGAAAQRIDQAAAAGRAEPGAAAGRAEPGAAAGRAELARLGPLAVVDGMAGDGCNGAPRGALSLRGAETGDCVAAETQSAPSGRLSLGAL
jgi:hypothetical protein